MCGEHRSYTGSLLWSTQHTAEAHTADAGFPVLVSTGRVLSTNIKRTLHCTSLSHSNAAPLSHTYDALKLQACKLNQPKAYL